MFGNNGTSFNPFIKQNIADYKNVGIKLLNLMNWNIRRIKSKVDFRDYNEIIDNVFEFGLQSKTYEISRKENKSFIQVMKGEISKWTAHA